MLLRDGTLEKLLDGMAQDAISGTRPAATNSNQLAVTAVRAGGGSSGRRNSRYSQRYRGDGPGIVCKPENCSSSQDHRPRYLWIKTSGRHGDCQERQH